MENKYPVSYISRLRMGIDGHGIRTLILFQGCSLRCQYCLNPFTWNESREAKMMTVKEMYEIIRIDRPYILATNGGVTFGGGEPLSHSAAIKEFSKMNEDKFSIYVETSLNVPREKLELVIDVIDRYYVDIKSTDPEIYEKYTGGDLQAVFDNLKYLIECVGSEKVIVRIPIIQGLVNEEQQRQSKEYLKSFGVRNFDLFEYNILNEI